MITTLIVIMGQTGTSMLCLFSANPIKISFALMMLSTFMFYEFTHFMGGVLAPMILYLMFMGGILVTFMIISAVIPSAKISKMNKESSLLLTILVMVATFIWTSMVMDAKMKGSSTMTTLKSIMTQLPMMVMMIMILMIYFFIIMSMISSNKANLRTLSWCQ